MLGLMLYSRDLYLDQCKLHLEDGKETYERTSEPKKQILVSLVDRLNICWRHTRNPALLSSSNPKHS